jgi:hypothetical protein
MSISRGPGSSMVAIETKTPDYSFDEGVEKSVERIQQLIRDLKRDVFVFVNGSSIEVGKTTLIRTLATKLHALGIPCEFEVTFPKTPEGEIKKVVFREQINGHWKSGESYRDALRKANPNLGPEKYGDLYIGIYRPDRKFKPDIRGLDEPTADIMIRNTQALDRPK